MGAKQAKAEMSFVNELGNRIRIWVEPSAHGLHVIAMEGPSSRFTNEVTKSEVENLFRVLGAYLGAPVRPADMPRPDISVRVDMDADHLRRLSETVRKPHPLESLTDDGLVDRLAEACDAYEDVVEGLNESGGAGGSPLEGVSERVEEIVTVMKRRGLDIPSWATTPGGRRPKDA